MNYMLVFLGWIGCGVLGAGLMNAYHLARFPNISMRMKRENRHYWLCVSVATGPIGLIPSMVCSNFGYNGWTLSVNRSLSEDVTP